MSHTTRIRISIFADPDNPGESYELPMSDASPKGGFTNQEKVTVSHFGRCGHHHFTAHDHLHPGQRFFVESATSSGVKG